MSVRVGRSRPRPAAARGGRRGERIGILGGTFDPPHVGHLALAEWAREELALDRVLFVPAGSPPHKRGLPRSSTRHRLAMTRLAVRGNRAFAVSPLEAARRGPSYTADTVRAVARANPAANLWVIMGADMYATFAGWVRPAEIAAAATIAVAVRPGVKAPRRVRGVEHRVTWLHNPALEISSTSVRALAHAGRSLRYLVPPAVARYVSRTRLYGGAA